MTGADGSTAGPARTLRALVADDERLLREQLKSRLADVWSELLVCGEARDGEDAVRQAEALRPDGSPIRLVKSPIKKITVCPRSCSWRILLSTTVWPKWMSGAVGSSPNLMRSGTPVAALRANLRVHSCSGINSSQPRNVTASAALTSSVTANFVTSS